ncbi:hypothetical protein KM043_015701 [Ampulex compressa]|nr:hypothetical protein KM043_015701 [Ampulex compressa]
MSRLDHPTTWGDEKRGETESDRPRGGGKRGDPQSQFSEQAKHGTRVRALLWGIEQVPGFDPRSVSISIGARTCCTLRSIAAQDGGHSQLPPALYLFLAQRRDEVRNRDEAYMMSRKFDLQGA